jgi:hypothetical protein
MHYVLSPFLGLSFVEVFKVSPAGGPLVVTSQVSGVPPKVGDSPGENAGRERLLIVAARVVPNEKLIGKLQTSRSIRT